MWAGFSLSFERMWFLLSRGLRIVKDLQSLLWGERGAYRRDEVTNVFDLRDTKFDFLGVSSDILSAKALEYFRIFHKQVHWGPCSAYCAESKGQILSVS